jgi:hypothetical protein
MYQSCTERIRPYVSVCVHGIASTCVYARMRPYVFRKFAFGTLRPRVRIPPSRPQNVLVTGLTAVANPSIIVDLCTNHVPPQAARMRPHSFATTHRGDWSTRICRRGFGPTPSPRQMSRALTRPSRPWRSIARRSTSAQLL